MTDLAVFVTIVALLLEVNILVLTVLVFTAARSGILEGSGSLRVTPPRKRQPDITGPVEREAAP